MRSIMAKKVTDVNFIKHLLTISEKFIDDQRLSPLHISLYYALFQSWNLSMFRNPISVCREELMQASKIGSANTYTKCLKELDAWAYIKYLPSHNPHKGSQIYLYNFNKTPDNGINNTSDKSSDKTSEKDSLKVLRPSINSKNKTNNKNHGKHEHTRSENGEELLRIPRKKTNSGRKRKKIASKKESASTNTGSVRPLLSEVRTYFIEQKWPIIEAEKFFNHYQSNGWLVGGKTPMKDWQASSKNWILNSNNFVNGKKDRSGRLNVTTDKNYSEPL